MNLIMNNQKILLLAYSLMVTACATVVGADNNATIDLKQVDMIRYTEDLNACRNVVKNLAPVLALATETKTVANSESKTAVGPSSDVPNGAQGPKPLNEPSLNPVINCLLKRGYTLLN